MSRHQAVGYASFCRFDCATLIWQVTNLERICVLLLAPPGQTLFIDHRVNAQIESAQRIDIVNLPGDPKKNRTLGNSCKTVNLLLNYWKIAEHNVRSWEHRLVKNLRNQMNRTRFMSSNVTSLLFTKRVPDGGHRAGDIRLGLQKWFRCGFIYFYVSL